MTAANQNVTHDSAENADDTPTVKAPIGLKILVTVLGIAIIGMLGLIIFKIISGDHKKTKPAENVALPAISAAPITTNVSYEDVMLTRPKGMELVNVSSDSVSLVLQFKGPSGTVVMLVDKNNGKTRKIEIPK